MSNKQSLRKSRGGNGAPKSMIPPPMSGKPVLNLNEMRSFKCLNHGADVPGPPGENCGSKHFEPVVVLKLVSALEKGNPTGKTALAPMMPPNAPFDWKCTQCGRIYTSREIIGE